MLRTLTTLAGLSPAEERVFAIGDIHGCYKELVRLIGKIKPTKTDTLIFLGDYIDRGYDSRAVLNYIIELKNQCKVVALLGNHEAMMRDSFTEQDKETRFKKVVQWCSNGGDKTLASYMMSSEDLLFADGLSDIYMPESLMLHLEFISSLPTYYETNTHIFVHASPRLDIPLEFQPENYLIWRRAGHLDEDMEYTHISGKTIVCGHTAQASGRPVMLSDKKIIIDSGCYATGWLTAMDVDSGHYIQANSVRVRRLSGLKKKIS